MTVTLADTMPVPRHPPPMLPLLKRHEIQVLAKTGLALPDIASLAGVSARSARRVLGEPPVEHTDDHLEHKKRRIGRPSLAEPFRSRISTWLAQQPDIASVELLRRAKSDGYSGAKSALFRLIAELRPKEATPLVRFEGLAGEFSQHDFGEIDVRFLDGSKKRIHFFASRLKFSRWMSVSIVPDQTAESLIRALVEHFDAWGGLPLLAVFDRPKTIAIRWDKDGTVTEWNSLFSQVVLDLGLGVELCWPYRPNQKGSVENLVGYVKGSFFKWRKFHDDDDLREQLRDWLLEVNTERPCRATKEIPLVRFEQEKTRFRPLKIPPDRLALRTICQVNAEGYVLHDGARYSMPVEAIRQSGTLYLMPKHVRIVVGSYSAEHTRLFEPGAQSTLPEHRRSLVEAAVGKRGKLFAKRQQLLALDAGVEPFLTELIHREGSDWSTHVEQLFEALQQHGPALTLRAILQAAEQHLFNASAVLRFLPASSLAPARLARAGDEEPPRGPPPDRTRRPSGRAELRRPR